MLRSYLLEMKCELLRLVRLPAYAVPTLAAPVLLYVFFGIVFGGHVGHAQLATYLLATYGAFGVIGVSLFGFGVGVAVERGQGWLLVKRASPMPRGSFILAKLVAAAAFGLTISLALLALGVAFGGVRIDVVQALALVAILLAGVVPFCAIGLAIGMLGRPNSAPAIVNVLYLPMGFLSGLWIPIAILPSTIQHIALVLPGFHLGELALDVLGIGDGAWVQHVSVLVAYSILGCAAAALAFRRDEQRLYG